MTLTAFKKRYKIENRELREMSLGCDTWFVLVLFDKVKNDYVKEYNEKTKKIAMKRFSSVDDIFDYVEKEKKKNDTEKSGEVGEKEA